MTALRSAAQQALEALEGKRYTACGWRADCDKAITALRAALVEDAMQKFTDVNQELEAALAEPVQDGCDHCNHPMYAAIKCRVCGRVTKPAQPQRKPLTDDEIKKLLIEHAGMTVAFSEVDLRFARAIEAKHGIGVDK